MLGPRITTVFRSKWRTLWWAASVLLGAWFTVPHGTEKPDADVQKGAEAVAALLHDQPQAAPSESHAGPWDKTAK